MTFTGKVELFWACFASPNNYQLQQEANTFTHLFVRLNEPSLDLKLRVTRGLSNQDENNTSTKAGFNVGPVSQSPTRLKMQADCVECRHKTRLTGAWASSSRCFFFAAGTRQISRGLATIPECGQFNGTCCNSSEIGTCGALRRADSSEKLKGVLKTSQLYVSLCSLILLRVLLR